MKHKPLPDYDYLVQRFSYNEETGELIWKEIEVKVYQHKSWNTKYAGKPAGTCNKSSGYLQVILDGVQYYYSRIVWKLITGEDPGEFEVDHIDLDKSNHKRDNLRLTTRSQNNKNKAPKSNTGERYITLTKYNTYLVQWNNPDLGTTEYLGTCKSLEEAKALREARITERRT
ncbi:hypothetical protein NKFEDGME_00094 [Salmonella phage STP-SP2]|uniref:Putative HNH endonuclease n=1 Tax=Salmonella phage NR01 TaxID=1647411 RepID=A0A159B8Y9_9CAUD|nr:HNH endonuclease [Salmonella phage NR01]AKN44481.1 putative HNH endonuclease [Salmonella phage NR01]WPJ68295.1 hypothetical protein NKFEDGME_00094 [Salmonella phage STP-SP2]